MQPKEGCSFPGEARARCTPGTQLGEGLHLCSLGFTTVPQGWQEVAVPPVSSPILERQKSASWVFCREQSAGSRDALGWPGAVSRAWRAELGGHFLLLQLSVQPQSSSQLPCSVPQQRSWDPSAQITLGEGQNLWRFGDASSGAEPGRPG